MNKKCHNKQKNEKCMIFFKLIRRTYDKESNLFTRVQVLV